MTPELERALKVIPGAAQTRSKQPTQFIQGVYPQFATSAFGSNIFDERGNGYIDFISSLGAIFLGYGFERGIAANAMNRGAVFSLPSVSEVNLAENLARCMPFAPLWRFATNGMDTTVAAVKLARAFTGNMKIISTGYHGHWEQFSCKLPLNAGANPKLKDDIIEIAANDIEELIPFLEDDPEANEIACFIIEFPDLKTAQKPAMKRIQDLCNKKGIVLIVDEVLTWGRYGVGGISSLAGLTPDLICLGKCLANGYPLSALGGREDLMRQLEGNVFFSNTFSGFNVSVEIANNLLPEIEYAQKKVWEWGESFMAALNKALNPLHFKAEGDPVRFQIKWYQTLSEGAEAATASITDALKRNVQLVFHQELCKLGILTMPNGVLMPTLSHVTEYEMGMLVYKFKEAALEAQTAELEGEAPRPTLLQRR